MVRRPDTASYGGAVKWLWLQPQTEWFLHLEDDWILSHRISLRRLAAQAAPPDVAQININNWSRFSRRRRPVRIGLTALFCRSRIRSDRQRSYESDLDPDKQFRGERNPEIVEAIRGWRAVFFGTMFTPQTAIDIGRAWRDERQIEKRVVGDVSVWTEGQS